MYTSASFVKCSKCLKNQTTSCLLIFTTSNVHDVPCPSYRLFVSAYNFQLSILLLSCLERKGCFRDLVFSFFTAFSFSDAFTIVRIGFEASMGLLRGLWHVLFSLLLPPSNSYLPRCHCTDIQELCHTGHPNMLNQSFSIAFHNS